MISRVSSEAFSYSYASISVLRVNVSTSPLGLSSDAAPQAGGGTTATSSGNDSVTLSPQALAAGESTPTDAASQTGQSSGSTSSTTSTSTGNTGGTSPAGTGGATSTSATGGTGATTGGTSSEQKIAALIKALDSDGDGALSEEEFVEGAKRLLRGKHGHHHGHRAERADGPSDGDNEVRRGEGHHGRGRGLEKRLEKAFGAIDANGDGSLSQDELVSALNGATKGGQAPASNPPSNSTSNPTTTSTASSTGGATTSGTSTSGTSGTSGTSATPATPVAGGGSTTAAPLAVPPQPATGETTPANGTTSGAPTATGSASSSGASLSLSFTSVTYVSVAIRQYSAVSQLASGH